MRVCCVKHKWDCLIQLGTRLPKSDPCHAQCANYPNPAKSPVGHTEELWAAATATLMQATAPDALLPSISSTRDQSVFPVSLFIFYLAPRRFSLACLYRNVETRRFASLLQDTVAVGDNQSWQWHTPSKPAPRRRGDVPKNTAGRSDVRTSRVFLLLVTMSLPPRSQIAERRLEVRQRRKQHP